mmetsp:Transcript_25774/g.76291  ORF Transcript_25774/g.76291 Transcript_25774/m.76291 type:complete len:233 (-) Transcript_25774:1243-1941(-)
MGCHSVAVVAGVAAAAGRGCDTSAVPTRACACGDVPTGRLRHGCCRVCAPGDSRHAAAAGRATCTDGAARQGVAVGHPHADVGLCQAGAWAERGCGRRVACAGARLHGAGRVERRRLHARSAGGRFVGSGKAAPRAVCGAAEDRRGAHDEGGSRTNNARHSRHRQHAVGVCTLWVSQPRASEGARAPSFSQPGQLPPLRAQLCAVRVRPCACVQPRPAGCCCPGAAAAIKPA